MTMYVLYKKPLDYPQGYVLRRWTITEGKSVPHEGGWRGYTKEDLEELVPNDMVWTPRHVTDDPCIEGVWI